MPANAPSRIGPRSALPAAQTGYEIAQVVKASPTDPYSPTAAGTSSGGDLMQALGVVSDKVVPVALKAGEVWAGEQKKKGVEARFVGDALDPNQSNAFIDGFERMDGQYRGIAFGNAAQEYAKTNSHLDPIKFQEGLDALQKEYVGKLVHQGQLDTFLPDALQAGKHAADIYQEAKNAEIIHERDAKITDIHTGKAKLLGDKLAAEILGIPLSNGLDSIATDPEMRARFDANEEPFRVAYAAGMRQIMEESVSSYLDLGVTPRAARANLVDVVGRKASDIGANSLNDAFYQKDSSGRSPAMSFPDVMDKNSDRARASGEHISNAMILRKEKAQKAADEKQAGDWLVALADPNVTVAVANKIKQDVMGASTMSASDREKIANHAADVMLGQGYALKDNLKVAGDLEYQIRMEKLSGHAANIAILAAAPKLSLPTVRHLYAIAKEHKDKAGDHTWSMFSHEANTKLSNLQKDIGLTDSLGNMMINLSIPGQSLLAQVRTNATNEWFRGVDLLSEKHGGAPFDGAELDQLYDRIVKHYTPQKENIAAHYMATGGQETNPEPSSTRTQKASSVITSTTIPKGKIASPAHAVPPEPAPTVIPQGFVNSGKTVGGKAVYQSPDGTQSIVVN